MPRKKKNTITNKLLLNGLTLAQKMVVMFFVAVFLFLLEPTLRGKFTFAIVNFDQPKVSYDSSNHIQAPYITSHEPERSPQKSHAPEPTTILLMLSGIGGLIVRFAQKSFSKFKRMLDYFIAILGLILVAPLLLILAIIIKLNSPGPVIYRQNRVGRRGKVFKIYKLRTMRIDAEKYTGAVWASENDPRVTSVGRFLRKVHLDEIPQLVNVIKGEMSIVGPRPERPEMVRDLKKVIVDYEKRLEINPGITGLAQVVHKYDETIADVRKKVKYDLLYMKKMCWMVEMRILAQTFIVALTGKGAR